VNEPENSLPAATGNSASPVHRYSWIFPNEQNVPLEITFPSSGIPVHPEEQRLCTAVLSISQPSTDFTLFHSKVTT
jgi:hypothetical protein